MLAVAYLGGITSVGGAVIAGVIGPLGIVYVLLHNVFEFGDYYALISGLALIVTAIVNPVGVAGEASRIADLVRTRRLRPPIQPGGASVPGTDDRKVGVSDVG